MNTFPGEMPLKGKSVAAQAKNVGYQDLFRNIQAMREATYRKEVARGEFSSEFSGLGESLLSSVAIIINTNKPAALFLMACGLLPGYLACKYWGSRRR